MRCFSISWMKGGAVMTNMIALNTVYNHYLTTYSRGSASKYDAHKRSELRNIYNSIVKLNKESPLYLLKTNRNTNAFVVGIKEGATELHNTIVSLGGMSENQLLNKKVAFSTDENIVSAQYINEKNDGDWIPSYDIEVRALASPQINLGNYLPSDSMELPAGTYSFDVNIHNMNYEFQYNITEEDTNKMIQEKLARLISGAGIGIDATVETAGDLSALRLVSSATGVPIGKDTLFSVSDTHSSKMPGSVDYFGIAEVTRPSSNALLLINGVEKSVSSNHFTLEKTYELTLNGVSPVEGQSVTVSVKNDTESLGENINKLIGGYNSFLRLASHSSGRQIKKDHLLREMKGITSVYKNGLHNAGMDIGDDGSLSLNSDAYSQSLETGDAKQTVAMIRNFADSLLRKTSQISLDPMQYVDRTMVAYKNPARQGRNYATPYVTSAYSGMMFNSYC